MCMLHVSHREFHETQKTSPVSSQALGSVIGWIAMIALSHALGSRKILTERICIAMSDVVSNAWEPWTGQVWESKDKVKDMKSHKKTKEQRNCLSCPGVAQV